MATIATPATVVVIEIAAAELVALHPRTGEPLVFASVPAAQLAMRDLALSPVTHRITERTLG